MGNCPSGDVLACPWLQSYYIDTDYALPSLGADSSSVTVSGFSSGSSMAGIMHVIYSETIKGSGNLAGTPYGFTTSKEKLDPLVNIRQANDFSNKGKIDNVSNLKDHPVYILNFDRDDFVQPVLQSRQAQKDFYQNYGANVKDA